MKALLTIKEYIMKFAGKYEVYITPVLKFLLTYISISRINADLGFMTRIASKPIALIIALAGSFLPLNLTIVILGLIVVAHAYALSLQVAIIVFAVFLILFLLYIRFASKDAVALLLVPICFFLKIPYVMPVAMGLVGTPSSIVSVGSGVIVYYMLNYISSNSAALAYTEDDASMISQFKEVADALLSNRVMVVMAIAFMVTVLVVYLIRRLPVSYCWYIAIGVGAVVDFLFVVIGSSRLGIEISGGSAFLGMLISIILNIILQFFCFNLDYNRTEKVQFEDDEYYYYVKAVPKNTIKLPQKKSDKPANSKTSAGHQETVKVRKPAAGKTSAASQKPQTSRSREAVKAPFGLTGGRPAGEGRRRTETDQSTQADKPEKVIEHFTEDELK